MDIVTVEAQPSSNEIHPVVSADHWVVERKTLLARGKELVQLSDEIARARRALPWERVAKDTSSTHPVGGARCPICSTDDRYALHPLLSPFER